MTSDEAIADSEVRSSPPQVWEVKATDSKFYWYDLLTDYPPVPDFRDPIGRYLRRMQFALDATMEKRLMYYLISRPRLRLDTKRPPSWSFFSLKLNVPVLVGAEEKREALTIELKVPFEATLKKPTVQVTEHFLTLHWGSMVETFSVHDLVQQYTSGIEFPSKILYVGQTRDTAARLAKGRVVAVNRLCDQDREENDYFLLVQQLDVSVKPDTTPRIAPEVSALEKDARLKGHMSVLEAVLISYFEGEALRHHGEREKLVRTARLRKMQRLYQLEKLLIDLAFEPADAFQKLYSNCVEVAPRHVFECTLEQEQTSFKNIMTGARRTQ